MEINLMQGDCLERMKDIPDGSVDMILTDPPYGTMKGAGLDGWHDGKTDWDSTIETSAMLGQCNRILRTNGALILFSQEPYTSHLITNAHGNIPFSYRMVWLKDHFANALIAKKAPVSYFEDMIVFFKKYDTLAQHPLRDYAMRVLAHCGGSLKAINAELGHRRAEHFFYIESTQFGLCTEKTYRELCALYGIQGQEWFKPYAELKAADDAFKASVVRTFNLPDGKKYKSNILEYKKDYNGYHPTQKPVRLYKWLLTRYAKPGDKILDTHVGSGSSLIACYDMGFDYIGFEIDKEYYEAACKRIAEEQAQLRLYLDFA